MATAERGARKGPVERAAEAVPPPAGRAFRWIVVTLLAVSTASLLAATALLWMVLQHVAASDASSLKAEVDGVKSETAAFHADVTKGMAAMQKGLAQTAGEVNSATLQLNDIALSLHRKP